MFSQTFYYFIVIFHTHNVIKKKKGKLTFFFQGHQSQNAIFPLNLQPKVGVGGEVKIFD